MRTSRFLLFILLALFYANTVSAIIVGNQFTRDGITYEVTYMDVAHDGHPAKYEVKFVSSNLAGALSIPGTVADPNNQYTFNVTAIAANSTVPNATSVTIPSSVTTINANSFKGSNITSINIPATVTDIQDGAFSYMEGLKAITVDAGSSKYSATDGVLYENKAEGKYLSAYPVAKDGTPFGVGGLEFTVPEGVVGVSTNGFQKAGKLSRINLPASLKYLPTNQEGNGFTSATNLKEIKVAATNPNFQDIDGVVVTKDGKTLVSYPNNKGGIKDTNYDAPLSIDPTHAKRPGEYYEIPAGVEIIKDGAFAQVQTITAVKLNDVKTIKKGAFYSVRNLRNVEISSSVTSIEDGAITGSPDLLSFKIDAGNPNYMADSEGVIYNKAGTELVLYPAGRAGEYSTLPTTQTIRNRAFYQAQKVTKVNFNSGLTDIGNDCFQAAAALKEITFTAPSTLKNIGTFSFYGTGLEHLTIPASVENIGWNSFSPTKLKTVEVENGSKLKTIARDAFANNTDLEEFKFLGSSDLEKIEKGAFKGNTKLKEFTIPKNVTTIERGAFDGNSAMEKVTFDQPAKIQTIGEGAFQGAQALKRIELPNTVTTISKDAFNTCKSLTEIVIPSSVTSIDPTGFQECGKLEKFTVDQNNPVYSSVDGFLLSKDKKVLKAFPPAKANTYYTLLPPTIEEIGAQAFYYVQELENVTIPEKVTKIDKFAFDRTAKLNTIAFLGQTPITNVDPSAFNPANVNTHDIQISVRKNAQAAFASNAFWSNFKQLGISFFEEVNGTGNGETEFFPLSQKAVMVVDTKADVFTYVVPKTVTNSTDNHVYEIRLWGDYALKDSPATSKFEEVVFKNQLDYMGLNAFDKADGSSSVKRIFFTSNNPTKDMSATKWEYGNTQHEFNSTLKIYVKKSALDDYKSATGHEHAGWGRYANQVDYKIPNDVKVQHFFATFAREFDADLGIYKREKGGSGSDVGAFIVKSSNVFALDNGTALFKMTSINGTGSNVNRYNYVPANNGVILATLNGSATPADFYYAIGEEDNAKYTPNAGEQNIVEGVTVKDKSIQSTAAAPLFGMSASKGTLLKIPATPFNMKVHKAFVKGITGAVGSAKVSLVFDDEWMNGNIHDGTGNTAGISDVESNTKKQDGVYYNLQGQRVSNPQHGIFIQNGKKVVLP